MDMESKKKNIAGLTILILGVIVLVIGIIAVNNTDMSKYKTASRSGSRESFTEEYSAEGIEDIKISLDSNDYTIIFDDSTDRIKIEAEDYAKDSYKVENFEGTFRFEPKDENIKLGKLSFHFWLPDLSRLDEIHSVGDLDKLFDDDDGKMTITIPKNLYDEVHISAGVGDLVFKGCECKTLHLSAGVGNVDITDVKADEGHLSAGVGNIDGTGINFEDFHLSAGVGNVDLAGFVGDSKISCGVGNVKLHVKNSSNNYHIKEDNADIHEGGSSVSDKDYDMKISSGLGDCDIYFE